MSNSSTLDAFAASINPATGELIARYPFAREKDLEAALTSAKRGYRAWSSTPVELRTGALRNLGAILRRDVEVLARMTTDEMGKPIVQARAEVEKCAAMCDWYIDNAAALLADQPTTIGTNAYVSYLPIGTVLAVMPWNFPFWQVLRGAIPILLGGNGYLLKHAPNVMGCAYLMQKAMEEAQFPSGTFQVANLSNDLVSKAIADPRIAAVAVTGSARAGSAIAAQAGAALKKTVLELGGSDPFIVLADADLDAAVQAAIVGRFQNCGQICIAAKRIILEKSIAQPFTDRFVEAVEAMKVGDPGADGTFIGPMARADLRDELHFQVLQSIEAGAKLLTGGKVPAGVGSFYTPTVIADVRPGMPAFDQETFGPAAALITANNPDHAIELANRSVYGLGGALWTRDADLAKRLARQVETGGLFVNGVCASDPRVPIGGVKQSGYGRELSNYGVHEFMNVQTVWFDRR